MLVLSRKTKETIKIGDDVEISVLSVEGDQVRIGINAPKSIDVHRGEVYKAIQLENSEAANVQVDLTKLFIKD